MHRHGQSFFWQLPGDVTFQVGQELLHHWLFSDQAPYQAAFIIHSLSIRFVLTLLF